MTRLNRMGQTPYTEFRILPVIEVQRDPRLSQDDREQLCYIWSAVLHQSPDKRGVPLPVKMVSQLTQTWHSQVRSFC